MEHGLEYIMFYFQNHMTPLAVMFWFVAGSRQAAKSTGIARNIYYIMQQN